MEFSEIKLHDASLEKINFDLISKELYLLGKGFDEKEQKIVPFQLSFVDVAEYFVSKLEEWGATNSINKLESKEKGVFTIEMQSGDVIRVVAKNFNFNVVAV